MENKIKYSQIKCIDESWLNEKWKLHNKMGEDRNDDISNFIKELRKHITSATTILEKAFEAGETHNENKKDIFYTKASTVYNDFKQFLNTEVK